MTQIIKNIVVGYDFSETSKNALKVALDIAQKTDGELHLVSALPGHLDPKVVWDATEFAKPRHDQLYSGEDLMESLERRLRDSLEGFEHSERVKSVEVMKVKPAKAILETADLYDADLIVVGSTGLNALQKILIGSTSQRLVHSSRWPVLVVKPDSAWPPTRVMCSVDFSEAARTAASWGAELAKQYNAGMTVANVVETTPARMLDAFGVRYVDDFAKRREQLRAEAHKDIEAFCGDISEMDKAAWSPLVLDGTIDERIIETAQTKTDLLCMGSVGRSGFQGLLLGNTAERVLRQLPCSMLILKPDDFVFNH